MAHEFDNAVYLTGNGPLVDVLQDTLQNETFVQGLYNYKMQYWKKERVPYEHIIIFDEAQRAWDANKVDVSLEKTTGWKASITRTRYYHEYCYAG